MQLKTHLKQFGLTDNEAKVYLATLELGTASIQDISKKSKVKRTTIYTTIAALQQKGLISQTKKGVKTDYLAENPEKVAEMAKRQFEALNQALPQFKSIYNTSDIKPKLAYYEGREGYVSIYDSIIKEQPADLLIVSSYNHLRQHLDPQYEAKWMKRRIENNIKLRWLVLKTAQTSHLLAQDLVSLRETRFLPPKFNFTSTVFIYNNKAILVSGKQRDFSAIVIENAEFQTMFKQFFEMMWSNCSTWNN